MVGRHRGDEPLPLDRHQLELAVELGELHRPADHPDIELAADERGQLRHRRELSEHEIDIGMAVAELAQHVRERRAEHRRADEADRERPLRSARDRPGAVGRSVDRCEDRACVLEEALARGGERHPAPVAGEQCDAELALERADLLAQRRLRDMQPRRRPMEMQLLGHRDEVTKMPQLHRRHPTPARAMRDNPPRMPDETASAAAQLAPAHADAIEIFAEVLAQSEEEGLGDDFYSRLCEGITRCTALRRVVIFRYDSTRRRILAAGAFGVDLALFAEDFFTLESAALAREALEQDRVLETSDDLALQLPAEYVERLQARTVVCSPMSARGRWLGAILGDRGGDGPPLTASEREVLWILGKMAALAAMARAATRQHERAVALEQRIDLARGGCSRERAVQGGWFWRVLALSGNQPFDEETRRRCAEEVQQALGDLRTALQRPLGRSAAATRTRLAEEVMRLRHEYPELGITVDGAPVAAPETLEPLAQSVLSEAIRNAAKHSRATRVGVRTETSDGTCVLEVTNDGAHDAADGPAGMGLRLAGFEALQAGGLLEFGAREHGRWQVRLVVPFEEQ